MMIRTVSRLSLSLSLCLFAPFVSAESGLTAQASSQISSQTSSVSAAQGTESVLSKVSPLSKTLAQYSLDRYGSEMEQSLAELVRFNTEAIPGLTPDTNPEFIGFKQALKAQAEHLGLDYADHGYVLLIGLGEDRGGGANKLGIITHGDVQPANSTLWHQSPYQLDTQSQPGKLIGRGTEDDKGPIVTAMYAMKALKDKSVKLNRRIELMVYLAEESDWQPLKVFLKDYQAADMNITIDAEYPVVTAEKGWSQIKLTIPEPKVKAPNFDKPQLQHFSGGSFASQIPQQALALIRGADSAMVSRLQRAAESQQGMRYDFTLDFDSLEIAANGKSAHSSTPEDGVNAVTHLAALLESETFAPSQSALTLAFINEMIGLDLYAERFGELGYSDDFMGPMSLAPTVVEWGQGGTSITLNLRRPIGKSPETLDKQLSAALVGWQQSQGVTLVDVSSYWGEPKVMDKAPHLQTLLNVFAEFTGITDPKPVAIGGSTNSKLFPNALSFGPAMPGVEYTGHSEHEFITREQLQLNLKMYTAAMVELAVNPGS
ncbi:dipeptidase [Shewanella chilikensis]|uniref:dipeptidase n=1 Tax=Shewanella chilikensis TaxID=558541 RepID=UPI0020102E1B|nr:dipeptidase [Shewanella chilikensis]MCL1162598.1 dipeptidase [Shewanella chilikensis]